jgi:hypothetical protein
MKPFILLLKLYVNYYLDKLSSIANVSPWPMCRLPVTSLIKYIVNIFTWRRHYHYKFLIAWNLNSVFRFRMKILFLLPILIPVSLNPWRFIFLSHLQQIFFEQNGIVKRKIWYRVLSGIFFDFFSFINFLFNFALFLL